MSEIKKILPRALKKGDIVGLAAPAYMMHRDVFDTARDALEGIGLRVKYAKNLFSTEYGFAGSIEERADDFMELALDDEVKMVLFGGGEVANQILPLLDYEAIKSHPKIYSSYSDGTTLLDAIYSKTGIITFYGASPRSFCDGNDFNLSAIKSRFFCGEKGVIPSVGGWSVFNEGKASGLLVGGYLVNFAVMPYGKYLSEVMASNEKYIFFVEDHIKFNDPPAISKWFSHIYQSGFFDKVSALLVGYYSSEPQPEFDAILSRIADRLKIPVVKCDDFGHGEYNAVLPIGISVELDTHAQTLTLAESCLVK